LGCFEGGGIRGGSRMTPVEACFWMGVPNLLFITQAGNPPDTYAERRGNWKTNNPYVIADLPKPALSLCTFSDATGSITAAVEVLFGELKPQGQLPVRISERYPFGHGLKG
jgi:hypothetical protein